MEENNNPENENTGKNIGMFFVGFVLGVVILVGGYGIFMTMGALSQSFVFFIYVPFLLNIGLGIYCIVNKKIGLGLGLIFSILTPILLLLILFGACLVGAMKYIILVIIKNKELNN